MFIESVICKYCSFEYIAAGFYSRVINLVKKYLSMLFGSKMVALDLSCQITSHLIVSSTFKVFEGLTIAHF